MYHGLVAANWICVENLMRRIWVLDTNMHTCGWEIKWKQTKKERLEPIRMKYIAWNPEIIHINIQHLRTLNAYWCVDLSSYAFAFSVQFMPYSRTICSTPMFANCHLYTDFVSSFWRLCRTHTRTNLLIHSRVCLCAREVRTRWRLTEKKRASEEETERFFNDAIDFILCVLCLHVYSIHSAR